MSHTPVWVLTSHTHSARRHRRPLCLLSALRGWLWWAGERRGLPWGSAWQPVPVSCPWPPLLGGPGWSSSPGSAGRLPAPALPVLVRWAHGGCPGRAHSSAAPCDSARSQARVPSRGSPPPGGVAATAGPRAAPRTPYRCFLQLASQTQPLLSDHSLFLHSALVIVTVFDRNVNCRRAASVSLSVRPLSRGGRLRMVPAPLSEQAAGPRRAPHVALGVQSRGQ